MSMQSDLAAAFADVATTCPAYYAGQETRGFFDRAQQVATRTDIDFTSTATVLRIGTGALVDVVAHSALSIGALGAADAIGATEYTILDSLPEDDGAVTVLILTEGAP